MGTTNPRKDKDFAAAVWFFAILITACILISYMWPGTSQEASHASCWTGTGLHTGYDC